MAQQSSGVLIAAHCRQRRVPAASFDAWRRRLRRGTAHFADVRIAPDRPAVSSGIEVRLLNGRCAVVRAGVDWRTLLELLAMPEHGAGASATAVGGVHECRGARACRTAGLGLSRVDQSHSAVSFATLQRSASPRPSTIARSFGCKRGARNALTVR